MTHLERFINNVTPLDAKHLNELVNTLNALVDNNESTQLAIRDLNEGVQNIDVLRTQLDTIENTVDEHIENCSDEELELQVGNGYIQWRYKNDNDWNNLISITELQVPGPQGPQGIPGKDGTNGVDGATGSAGRDGVNGVTPNIQIGTVSTLEAGRPATVTKRGTLENPIFDFGIPKGNTGATPDMTEFKQNITKQYQDIEAKINKIEQSDTSVTTPIIGNILTLTTNKRQKTTMVNNTTIKLPTVNKFTEIQLTFNTTEALTLILPSIKWQSNISIEANKRYVFIFTYDDEWTGGVISYNA